MAEEQKNHSVNSPLDAEVAPEVIATTEKQDAIPEEEAQKEKTQDEEKVSEDNAPQDGHKLVSEDGTIMVRVGNFIVIKDAEKEHPYITVAPISRDWYVGYGPGSLVREYLETTLFADVPPTDTDIASCIMFFTGVMAGATILNAEFTNKVINAVQDMVENQPLNSDSDEKG